MKCDDKIVNRIKRTHGQMTGVLNLIEKEASCEEIINQLKAIKASCEKTISLIASKNLIDKIEEKYSIEINDLEESINLLINSN